MGRRGTENKQTQTRLPGLGRGFRRERGQVWEGRGRANFSRKGAVPGLDLPPTCSGARPEDVIPRGLMSLGSCGRAESSQRWAAAAPLRSLLVGMATDVIPQGMLPPWS